MSYSYIRNLQTTMVAFDVDVRDKLVVNSSPPSDTTELVLRVIEVNTHQVYGTPPYKQYNQEKFD